MATNKIKFLSGFTMPVFGLGTFLNTDADECERAVCAALDAGYSLIDTALSYQNERIIGNTLKRRMEEGKLRREDVFVTSKLPDIYMGSRERVRQGFMNIYESLQLDYVDLHLIHSPVGLKLREDAALYPRGPDGSLELEHCDLVETWKCLEELVDEGKIRSLGVSNFNSEQIERIRVVARHPICSQQIEYHVYLQQNELRQFCEGRGIPVTAFSSLGSPGYAQLQGYPSEDQPLNDPVVAKIAERLSKTPAQILLRFVMQEGMVFIPKSVNPERLLENIQVSDFSIPAEEMVQLRALGKKNKRVFPFNGFKPSPEYPFQAGF